MDTIGKRIRCIRENAKYSMEKLGENLGTSSSAISNWENDRKQPSAKMLIALSQFFDVSADWILTGEHRTTHSFFQKNGNVLTNKEKIIVDELRKATIFEQKDDLHRLVQKTIYLLEDGINSGVIDANMVHEVIATVASFFKNDFIYKKNMKGSCFEEPTFKLSAEEEELIHIMGALDERDVIEILTIARMKRDLQHYEQKRGKLSKSISKKGRERKDNREA